MNDSNQKPYRTLFVGTLVQESFLSTGGSDDIFTTVDSPFCRDGLNRPTLRGTGLAGALIATLRRLKEEVPATISGSDNGRNPSVWRFFNSHPQTDTAYAYRQHVAIDARTGAAADSALFNVETLPPGTCWPFLLEVDTARDVDAAVLARETLVHWVAGRCLIGREVARGMGWMRLECLQEYTLTADHIDQWPCAGQSHDYAEYISTTINAVGQPVESANNDLPGWCEITGELVAGERDDGYGIDSLSIGGHASEELAAAWDESFLGAEGMGEHEAKSCFDPDFAVVTLEQNGKRIPYIPGSSLRGPLRHALSRLCKSRKGTDLTESIFGTPEQSAKLLIRDAFLVDEHTLRMAWLQLHAEDEFTAGAYKSSKFDRVTVMQGVFKWKMVIENATEEEMNALKDLFALACIGQIGIGGGQWRGHGWLRWYIDPYHEPSSEIAQQSECEYEN